MLLYYLADLAVMLFNVKARQWLFSVYREEEHRRARLDMRICVIFVPLMCALVLVQYLFGPIFP